MRSNDAEIAARRAQVLSSFEAKGHEQKKAKDLDAFTAFLTRRSTESLRRASVFEATPSDVVDFLVHRDLTGSGRTTVHRPTCTDRSKGSKCGCPERMSQGAVRGLASSVRTRLHELGCGGEWSNVTASGNPANSALVRKYLTAITEEQGRAGCAPVSARQRAILPQKLKLLISSMRKRMMNEFLMSSTEFLTCLQDIAWITVQFRSLNRGSELSSLRTDQMVIGPNDSCIAFQLTFSKVLRGEGAEEFGVPAVPGDPSCPVRAMKAYQLISEQYHNWQWQSGSFPVFPYISRTGGRMAQPVPASTMGQRFNKHLERALADLGETDPDITESLHGLRAGGALFMALSGKSLADIMLQGFWKSPDTARRYIGLLERIVGDEFALAVRKHGIVQARSLQGSC